jgi:hypothetical protein
MKIYLRQHISLYSVGIFIFFAVCLFTCNNANAIVQPQAASSDSLAKEVPEPIAFLKKTSSYQYHLEGRPDPFLPFIADKTEGTLDPNELVDTNEQLTGMQLFEPGQLSLVALVSSDNQKFAMVQDVSGKGYIIKEGTKIGKRGVVRSIIPNKVLIEEIAMTRAGKKLSSDIVMVLRKEEKKK